VPDLSLEIRQMIFDHLRGKARTRCLQVSKRWYNAFAEMVYKKIRVDGTKLSQIACRLSSDGKLRSAIRHFTVTPCTSDYVNNEYQPKIARFPALNELVQRLGAVQFGSTTWANALDRGNPSAWLGTVLLVAEQLPRVTITSGEFVPGLANLLASATAMSRLCPM
jgi:hypothetical protein